MHLLSTSDICLGSRSVTWSQRLMLCIIGRHVPPLFPITNRQSLSLLWRPHIHHPIKSQFPRSVAFGNEIARMISLCSIIESNSYLRFPKSKQMKSWFTFWGPTHQPIRSRSHLKIRLFAFFATPSHSTIMSELTLSSVMP